MKTLPWWVGVAAFLLGAALVGGVGAVWLQGERAANQQFADALRAERAADSAAAAVRDAERARRLADLQRAIDTAAAREARATADAARALRQAVAARTARDSALGALGLTADELAGVQAAIDQVDQAHEQTLAAKDVELATVRSQRDDQARRAGEFEAQIAELRADLARQRGRYDSLEARFLDRKPAPRRLFGIRLPGIGCTGGATATRRGVDPIGVTCGLHIL